MRIDRIRRGFVVRNVDGSMQCSHTLFEEIQKVFEVKQLEYDGHEAIFFAHGTRTDCLMSVSLWRTKRGQGAGGVDFKPIPTMANFLMEGNLFSKSLGIKNALAGMWAGGGKGMIAAPEGDNKHLDPEIRRQTFLDFGDFLTSLNGCMVAGAGVGSCVTDMDTMFTHSRYVTNVSTDYGGCVNTAKYTGLGVVKAMEAAIDFLQMGCLEGKTVAIQGAGNVGEVIIDELLQKGVRHIYASECNNMRAVDMRDKFRYTAEGRLTISKVSFEDTSIFRQQCDIFSPCARGMVLNSSTIPLLDTKIICGASNCPVETVEDQMMLMNNKITYVTAVIPNRMGMVSKLLEPYGRMENDPTFNKHLSTDWEHSIYQTTLKILELAAEQNIPPEKAAYIVGERLSEEPHPLLPGRTRHIITSLVEDDLWKNGEDFWRSRASFLETANMI